MDEGFDFPKWDELFPDALGIILKNLSLREILTVVPRVCKSWEEAVAGPYCWHEIDIEEWSKNMDTEITDRMLRLLITRSSDSLRKLVVSGVASEETMSFIANHAQSLQTLRLPRSQINDQVLAKSASMLTTVTFLDLSYCTNLGACALDAIGKNCKSLTTLRRVMHPLEVTYSHFQDDEALAIASTMPKLKHLEISYLFVESSSVIEIINNCRNLELLDVQGCWAVNLEENFVKTFPKLKVVGPCVISNDYFEDISDGGDLWPWEYDQDRIDDILSGFHQAAKVADRVYGRPQF